MKKESGNKGRLGKICRQLELRWTVYWNSISGKPSTEHKRRQNGCVGTWRIGINWDRIWEKRRIARLNTKFILTTPHGMKLQQFP